MPEEGRGRGKSLVPVAGYFAALGLAYMLVELTFLKAGILVLGDAISAAALAIGGFSLFYGIGSAISGWRRSMRGVFAGAAACAAGGYLALSAAAHPLLAAGEGWRAAAFVASFAPALGMPFSGGYFPPRGGPGGGGIPFAWAANRFFSVAGASLASIRRPLARFPLDRRPGRGPSRRPASCFRRVGVGKLAPEGDPGENSVKSPN